MLAGLGLLLGEVLVLDFSELDHCDCVDLVWRIKREIGDFERRGG